MSQIVGFVLLNNEDDYQVDDEDHYHHHYPSAAPPLPPPVSPTLWRLLLNVFCVASSSESTFQVFDHFS